VRFFLLATLGLMGPAIAAPVAHACPGRTACLARPAVVTPAEVEAARIAPTEVAAPAGSHGRGPVPVLTLVLPTISVAEPTLSFDPMPDAKPIVRDMAAVFAQASRKVDQTMPSVQRPTYNVMASPVIVAGTFDTVPGVGLSGAF
jgi:hypothetical protein